MKAAAVELGLDVTDDLMALADVDVDLAVVVAYGRIIPTSLLQRVPMVNLHFSLLPRWRGAAPVERAILAGDPTTGVCLMEVAEGLDTGDIYDCITVPIDEQDTLGTLRSRLVELGTDMVVRCLRDGLPEPRPQVGEPVHAAKIDPSELRLDWSRPAPELARLVRLGGAWTTFRDARLKVWDARLLDARSLDARTLAPGEIDGTVVGASPGALELLEVQPEGRTRIPAQSWCNGARPGPGERLGT